MKTLIEKTWFLLFIFFVTVPALSQTGNYEIKITQPDRAGAKVGLSMMVQGTATIPANNYLWVLVHRIQGFKYVWYPQGEAVIDPVTHRWDVLATFGQSADIGFDFEIADITVDNQQHLTLENYITKAMTSGDWRPISMPPTMAAPQIIKVNKASH